MALFCLPTCSCPYAQRAWIALEELNVPYTTHLIDATNKNPAFKELYASIVQDPDMPAKVPTIIGLYTPPSLMCNLALRFGSGGFNTIGRQFFTYCTAWRNPPAHLTA